MEVKITSLEVIKTGTGKNNKPWTLVKCSVEGKTGSYTGFVYENVPKAGDILDVELFQEEYNGKMQDKFKILSQKKASGGGFTDADRENIRAIRENMHTYGFQLARIIDLLEGRLTKLPPYPTPEEEGIDVKRSGIADELGPEDLPF